MTLTYTALLNAKHPSAARLALAESIAGNSL
jgi:hypothetical protein